MLAARFKQATASSMVIIGSLLHSLPQAWLLKISEHRMAGLMVSRVAHCCVQNCIEGIYKVWIPQQWRYGEKNSSWKLLRVTNFRTFIMLMKVGCAVCFLITCKNSKGRMTVLLECNVSGTDELPSLVTGKSQESHCFKNVRMLPTKYLVIIKEWVTQTTLTKRLRALDAKMSSENRKILTFCEPMCC